VYNKTNKLSLSLSLVITTAVRSHRRSTDQRRLKTPSPKLMSEAILLPLQGHAFLGLHLKTQPYATPPTFLKVVLPS